MLQVIRTVTSNIELIELGCLVTQNEEPNDSKEEKESSQHNPIPPDGVFTNAQASQEVLTALAVLIAAPFIPQTKVDAIFERTQPLSPSKPHLKQA